MVTRDAIRSRPRIFYMEALRYMLPKNNDLRANHVHGRAYVVGDMYRYSATPTSNPRPFQQASAQIWMQETLGLITHAGATTKIIFYQLLLPVKSVVAIDTLSLHHKVLPL